MERSRYSTVAIVLHWTIAVLLIGNLVAGLLFDVIEKANKPLFFSLIQLHKSTGITILVLVVARLAWRLLNPPPRLPDHMTTAERMLAKLSHWGFYVVMLALPLSGWAMVSASAKRFPMAWYGTFEIPFLDVPKAWNYDGMHWFLGWLALAMIVLHVAAALKHQYMDRDNIFAPHVAGIAAGVRALLAAVLLLAAAPAWAAKWQVVPAQSRIGFTATWLGKPVEGNFGAWTAAIDFDPAVPDKAKIAVNVDLGSARTGEREVDGSLPGEDWFDIARTRTARFVVTRIVAQGPGRFVATGTLTIRGKAVPVTMPFNLATTAAGATMTGQLRVDRRSWALGLGSDATAEYVAFPVAITVRVVALKAP